MRIKFILLLIIDSWFNMNNLSCWHGPKRYDLKWTSGRMRQCKNQWMSRNTYISSYWIHLIDAWLKKSHRFWQLLWSNPNRYRPLIQESSVGNFSIQITWSMVTKQFQTQRGDRGTISHTSSAVNWRNGFRVSRMPISSACLFGCTSTSCHGSLSELEGFDFHYSCTLSLTRILIQDWTWM